MNKQKYLKTDPALKALLQHSNDIIIYVAADFTVTELNGGAEKFFNLEYKKIQGKDFFELCKSFNYACPISSSFFNNPIFHKVNADTKNSSGKQYNIGWSICPITLPDNTVTGAMLIGKHVETTRNNLAYYLNEIINCIPGCLYWKGCDGRYLGCNELTAKLAGLNSVYEVIGKTDEELWGKQANWLISNDKQVIDTGKTTVVEETLQAADGRWLYFTGVKMPLKDENNNIIGVIGNSLEITELKIIQAELRKSKEEAEALSKAKSEFIANMSHDVKTPLSGIIGLSEALQTTLKGKRHNLAQSLVLSGQQLMNFFDNCLDMAKSEEADITLLKEHFNLKLLLDQIVELFRPAAENKGVAFNLTYDNRIPASLLGSRASIYRILLNLVGNAIKFTPKGSVSVHAKLSKKSNKKQVMVRLIVEDTGVGIPKNKQKVIFERFTRLTPAYKGIYEGSGIGLHLVDKFVKAMQGDIYVSSEEGKGSRFLIVLPLESSLLDEQEYEEDILTVLPSPKISDQSQSNKQKNSTPRKKLSRVLLVEDNSVAQKIAQVMLAHFSQQLDIAENGEQALALFEPGKYDLVLMDIGLPDIPGYDVAKSLRKKENGTSCHAPIIALTAHANDSIKRDCLDSGMENVFSKPLSHELLQRVLNQLILPKQMSAKSLKNNANQQTTGNRTANTTITTLPVIEEKYVKELLDLLMGSLPIFCAEMAKAYEMNDLDVLIKLVHKFHGGVCYTSTPQLLKAARAMEVALKNGELNKIDTLYQDMKNAIRTFEKAYRLL